MDDPKENKDKISFSISIDKEKISSQYEIYIEGIKIYFPYKPYQAQIDYMTKVIQSLNKEQSISALESPTGTGKTLCLLCSVLGWLEQKGHEIKEIKNVYYCTKTVSQINNVLKELSNTCYKVINSFLTSRKFACLYIKENQKLNYDASLLPEICEKVRKQKNNKIPDCPYYSQSYDFYYSKYNNLQDIEDLFKDGENELFCPYFYNIKKTKNHANFTIMSYNYILNPMIRNKLDIINNNAIVLLDEAHNICSIFESLYSKKLEEKTLIDLQDILQIILDKTDSKYEKKIKCLNDEINKIKKFISKLEKIKRLISEKEKQNINNEDNHEITFLCSLDEFKNKIFKKFSPKFYEILEEDISELFNIKEDEDLENSKELKKYSKIKRIIKKMFNFLEQLHSLDGYDELSYKFTLSYNNKKEINFDIYCVDASCGMKNFLKIHPYSVILTSGTLSINMMENLLKVKFYKTLNNKHVINNDQFLMNIITGRNYKDYRFYYDNRNNESQIISLGKEINNLAKTVKIGGILVFFQSYDFLEKCHDLWSKNNIFDDLKDTKDIIFDIKQSDKNIEEKINKAKNKKNLFLFTVYRGKNSEGINFKDDAARMVICIGIPYPNASDIRVKLKKNFLDEKNEKEDTGYSSKDWYREEAYIAVNQSLGRLIRHKNDYGIMICFGKEFTRNSLFSEWIKPNEESIRLYNENDYKYYKKLEDFLNYMNDKFKPDENNIIQFEQKNIEYEASDEEGKEDEDSMVEIDKKYLEDEIIYDGDDEQSDENEITIVKEIKESEEEFQDENSNFNIIGHKTKRNKKDE